MQTEHALFYQKHTYTDRTTYKAKGECKYLHVILGRMPFDNANESFSIDVG